MGNQAILKGSVVDGAGRAAYFTEVDWVQQQCSEKLCFKPYPGTLNIAVDAESLPVLRDLKKRSGIEITSPNPDFCNARSLRASLGDVQGAIIIPAEDVNIHGQSIVEMIAPVRLREALSLRAGDRVEVVVEI